MNPHPYIIAPRGNRRRPSLARRAAVLALQMISCGVLGVAFVAAAVLLKNLTH